MSTFPIRRLRRLRGSDAMRELVRETRLDAARLVQPVFVAEDPAAAGPIAALPGISRFSLRTLDREIDRIAEAGVRALLIFGVPASKDERGSRSAAPGGVVQLALRRIRERHPSLLLITDVCLCSYTTHGHCGVVSGETIKNDDTLALLAATAVSHAAAGADVVAPSAMMDGQVTAIRRALDDAGYHDAAILSYATKFSSAFYGPFREAAGSAPQFGHRKTYQLDPANGRQAVEEARLDAAEGADMIMVKPALSYLDVITRVRDAVPGLPLFAYQVSGEFSMIKAAAQNGWLNEQAMVDETLTAIVRAGADVVITYFAVDVASRLRTTDQARAVASVGR